MNIIDMSIKMRFDAETSFTVGALFSLVVISHVATELGRQLDAHFRFSLIYEDIPVLSLISESFVAVCLCACDHGRRLTD